MAIKLVVNHHDLEQFRQYLNLIIIFFFLLNADEGLTYEEKHFYCSKSQRHVKNKNHYKNQHINCSFGPLRILNDVFIATIGIYRLGNFGSGYSTSSTQTLLYYVIARTSNVGKYNILKIYRMSNTP